VSYTSRCYQFLSTVLFAALLGAPAYATAISIIVGQQEITLAADSRISGLDSSGKSATGTECKVHLVNGLVFLSAGRYRDNDIKFDLLEVARRSVGSGMMITAAMDALKASLQTTLLAILASAKTRSPDDYKDWLSGRVPVISVAFGGFEQGRPKVVNCQFMLDPQGRPLPPACEVSQPSPGGDSVWLGIGSSDATKAVLSSNRSATVNAIRRNRTAFVKEAVELEIAANRLLGGVSIGPPITVATFDRAGLHWVERGTCTVPQ
jgi:hypothetical protein